MGELSAWEQVCNTPCGFCLGVVATPPGNVTEQPGERKTSTPVQISFPKFARSQPLSHKGSKADEPSVIRFLWIAP
jgi:hypothetical protein